MSVTARAEEGVHETGVALRVQHAGQEEERE
jgi:hypothetical protein